MQSTDQDFVSKIVAKVGENRERISRLETQITHFIEDFQKHDKREVEDRKVIVENLKEIQSSITDITNDLSKYRGFVGGVMLIFSGLGTIFVFFKESIIRFFSH